MHHFFVDETQITEESIRIEGPDVHHIRDVLRMKPGGELEIGDGKGEEYMCRIRAFGAEEIELEILYHQRSGAELASSIYLFQGLPKGDKLDFIIQKAVELGATGIVPVEMKRSVVRIDKKKAEKKCKRWNDIAASAAGQSKRGIIPQVEPALSFQEALRLSEKADVILVPYEGAENMQESRDVIGAIKPGMSVAVWIGPEGGFDKNEVAALLEKGGKVITLGKRILRTETAGLAVLSILMYHLEE